MKTIRKFTCDALIRLSLARNKAARRKSRSTSTTVKQTTDEKPPVDLNEVHRRFWAKLAGKE